MPTRFFRTCLGVFQGGGCRAAAHAGAAKAAMDQGVQFAEVAGTSAGSIVAALIGAGATGDFLEESVRGLNFRQFKYPAAPEVRRNIWQHIVTSQEPIKTLSNLIFDQGLYSSEEVGNWVEGLLEQLLPDAPRPVPFSALKIPTYIVASDLLHRKPKVWTQATDSNESVSKAVRASCSIPLFFQPVEHRYVDGGVLSNLPTFVFRDRESSDRPMASRILSFLLQGDAETNSSEWNTSRLLTLLIETIVGGSTNLQLSYQRDVHAIVIPTGSIKATDFDKLEDDGVNFLINSGRASSTKFLSEELAHVKAEPNPESVCYGTDERYNAITDGLFEAANEIIIAEKGTEWVFSLFPSLLVWRTKGCRIRVVLPPLDRGRAEAVYQRRLLRALGIEVQEVESVPFTAWLTNPDDRYAPRAVVGIPQHGTHSKMEAIKYEGLLNCTAIKALDSQIRALLPDQPLSSAKVTISATPPDELLRRLKTLPQYAKPGVRLTIETVHISRLIALTKYVREYKSRQIGQLIELYRESGLELFEPAVVRLIDGQESIITPPVLEESGEGLLLLEGSTRAVFCRDHGIDRFTAVVVRNVTDPLPSATVEFNRVRVVSKTLETRERYSDFAYGRFRHIENSVHPHESITE